MATISKEELFVYVGKKIKLLREAKGLSQQDLAALCNFEKSNLSRLEAGRTNPTIATLLKVSQALEIQLSDLLPVDINRM